MQTRCLESPPSTRLVSLCFDANEPLGLARFWAGALHWEIDDETDEEIGLMPTDGTLPFLFLPVPEPKAGKNRLHLDLVSESPEHQTEMVDRLMALGAQPVDIGQPTDVDHVVLADPEGNEFCVVLRGDFLATTDLLGAIVFEPAAPVVGRFWSEAAGWPLVYDQEGDTAIRAPDGRGPFVTFGPPTGAVKTAKNRLHLDIAPPPGGDQAAEVERLISLGARRIDIGQGDVSWVVMADPEGNEFCVLTPR
jgi:catechol 2,3-dioxygenase-like lactoylglutathione lyase family enzyme